MYVLHIGPEPAGGDCFRVGIALYEDETHSGRDWISLVHGWHYPAKRLLYIGEVDTVESFRRNGIALELLTQLTERFQAETVDAARTNVASHRLFRKLGAKLPHVRIIES